MENSMNPLNLIRSVKAYCDANLGDEKGATAVEYVLIVAGIAVVIVGGMAAFGGDLDTVIQGLSAKLKLTE
jgi:Flp pilus assembly pilin Flp